MKWQRVVVGFSGGVTSAWCAAWTLREYDPKDVVLLFHNTQEEDADTYRFIQDVGAHLKHPIIEYSDGRSVIEVCEDQGALANNRMAFCSRILKTEQRDKFFDVLRDMGVTDIVNVVGFSRDEWQRIQRAKSRAWMNRYRVRFPLVEEGITKADTIVWCRSLGLRLPAMYEWSEHANCVGCLRGGKKYWLAVKKNRPDVYEQRATMEEEYGHTIIKGISLRELAKNAEPVERASIDVGPCECGD